MAQLIGNLEQFDEDKGDWGTYVERVKVYFTANDITGARRVPALLSLIGPKTYGLLKTLIAPADPATKTFEQIVAALKSHLCPEPLVIAERFRFHRKVQAPQESVKDFVAELKSLASTCKFENNLDDSLRDKFVCGLRDSAIQKKLLTEKDLTFTKAVETAVSMEIASKDASELNAHPSAVSAQVHKFRKNQKPSFPPCQHCGKTTHSSDRCWHKNKVCEKCGQKGHVKYVCKPKPSASTSDKHRKSHKKSKKTVYSVEAESEPELLHLDLNHTSAKGNSEPIRVTPTIDGCQLYGVRYRSCCINNIQESL